MAAIHSGRVLIAMVNSMLSTQNIIEFNGFQSKLTNSTFFSEHELYSKSAFLIRIDIHFACIFQVVSARGERNWSSRRKRLLSSMERKFRPSMSPDRRIRAISPIDVSSLVPCITQREPDNCPSFYEKKRLKRSTNVRNTKVYFIYPEQQTVMARFLVFLLLSIIQSSPIASYYCSTSDRDIRFDLSSSGHSARQPSSNCSLAVCATTSNNACLISSTPCFDYRTSSNVRYCAPGSLCSILEVCDNRNWMCASDTSVCVVNSCCAPRAVCLPLAVTNLCSTSNQIDSSTLAPTCRLAFAPPLSVHIQSFAYILTVDDFNHDNHLDLVVSNTDNYTISVLLGYGNGSFTAPISFFAGRNLSTVVAGDFDGDNQLDLAVSNLGNSSIGVLLGYGNGSFQPVHLFSTTFSSVALLLGDFNEDNQLDLVLGNLFNANVAILLGDGHGNFGRERIFQSSLNLTAIFIGDFNEDRHSDLLTFSFYNQTVEVFLGDGNGTFSTRYSFVTGVYSASLVVADVNNDNHTDIISTDPVIGTIRTFLGYGNGTFAREIISLMNVNSYSVNATDFNGDDRTDLLTFEYIGGKVNIHLGYGNGTFASPMIIETNSTSLLVTVGDFNGDSRPDFATSHANRSNIDIFLNTCGSFNWNKCFDLVTSFLVTNRMMSVNSPEENGDDSSLSHI